MLVRRSLREACRCHDGSGGRSAKPKRTLLARSGDCLFPHRAGSVDERRSPRTDDGAGFDPEALRKRARRVATLGLVGMQERANAAGGVLAIHSRLSRGTEVRFTVPVDNNRPE